jgi:hypothetical protein
MEKIKVSDIRAKFPMYGDVSDEDLVLAVRKKHYADMPIGKFLERIEFQAADPTEGMSGPEKFMAGMGKGFTDLAQGIGQKVGLVSAADVAEKRKTDAALSRTGYGQAGDISANFLMAAPTAFIPGANTMTGAGLIGAAMGAMQPSESVGEFAKNTAMGGGLGAGGIAAGRTIGAGYQGAKSLVEPFTKGGQEKIAARTLQRFAENPHSSASAARNAVELVPGSRPTMAEATQDAGLAQLQRTLANNPDIGPALARRGVENSAARTDALRTIAGDDGQKAFYEAARSAAAKDLYGEAFKQGPVKMTAPLRAEAKDLMSRPAVHRAMEEAKELALNEGVKLTNANSIQGLHYAKMALDGQISVAVRAGDNVKARALQSAQEKLLGFLDKVSPSYGEARRQFADMSKPINQMDIGEELLGKLRPALSDFGNNTRETAATYAKALRDADGTAKRATGFSGAKMETVLSPEQFRTATSVAKDLARKANADELGKALGSNTAQNLVSQNVLRQMLGPTGLPQSWAENTMLMSAMRPMQWAAQVAEPRVVNRLGQAALDPQDAARLLAMREGQGLLGRVPAELLPYLPAGLLSGAYSGQ